MSTLEMLKSIPVLIDKFNFEIICSLTKEGNWKTENY